MCLISSTTKYKTKNISKAGKRKKEPKIEIKMEFKRSVSIGRVEIEGPLVTVSEGNCFEPWQKKAARHKEQHSQIAIYLLNCQIQMPCVVTLTRYGIKELDAHDNLRSAFKYIVDKIAEILTGKKNGKGDSDQRITWRYDQVKSKTKGIKIVFEF